MRVIMIIGLIGSGKDEATKYLIQKTGGTHGKLAGLIKDTAKLLFSWDERHTEGELKNVVDKEYGFSPREFFQWFGTECFQYKVGSRFNQFKKLIGRKFWVKELLKRNRGKQLLIVSDGRFLHEMEAFVQSDMVSDLTVIRIDRKPVPWYKWIFMHKSEKSIDDIIPDYIVKNTGTIEELHSKLDAICTNMGF